MSFLKNMKKVERALFIDNFIEHCRLKGKRRRRKKTPPRKANGEFKKC
ncbi:MAG: hypothetical protein WB424_16490 [Terracidiphilus sp.]